MSRHRRKPHGKPRRHHRGTPPPGRFPGAFHQLEAPPPPARPALQTTAPAAPSPPAVHSRIPEGWWEQAFCAHPTTSERRGHRCGERQMLTIVAYDITQHKRLSRIAKICEDYGVRVQYSVFECRLEADRFDSFWQELLGTIDPDTDRIVAYKVCAACAKETREAGIQTHHEKVVAYVF